MPGLSHLMDKIYAGLLGAPSNYGGLLDQSTVAQAQGAGQSAIPMALLAQSGWSDRPTTLGQAFANAAGAGRQAQNDSLQEALKAQLLGAQIARAQGNELPNSAQEYEYARKNGYTGTFEQWRMSQGTKAEPPASLQELQAVNEDRKTKGLKPYSIEDWYRVKAQMNPASPLVTNIAGAPTAVFPNKFDPQATTTMPLSTAAAEQTAASGAAGATASGKGAAERSQQFINAGQDAADSIATVRRGLQLLDDVQTGGIDAAKLKATNLFGVTGADEAELSANLGKAVLSQLRATFGAAFTEKEGSRLAEIEAGFGKSTEGNRRLLQQAEKILDRAARRGIDAAEKSGDTFTANEIRKSLEFSLSPNAPPKAGDVVDGYKFKGGNPADKANWEKQ